VSVRVETPGSARGAAELLASGATVRPRGGATKWAWAGAAEEPEVVLSTRRLGGVRELNAADLTAVLGAGLLLAEAQVAFAEAGLMLALDPPGEDATVGGVVAAADSGPLRHRYGAPRDLLLGMTVALADGTVARSGGKVIKNVAGYDLAKLFAGSYGTLGTIVEVVVRLHPLPAATATAVGAGDTAALARAALVLASAPLELERLDVRWAAGQGALLAQAGGVSAAARAARAAGLMREAGLDAGTHDEDDAALWAEQRAGQRAPGGTILRVAGLPAELGRVLAVAERHGAALVGRAAAGASWLRLDAAVVPAVRENLAPFPCVVTDGPSGLDRFGPRDPALVALERRVRERFDPSGVLA
jgi:glycolate oxidase FAD binding subunit